MNSKKLLIVLSLVLSSIASAAPESHQITVDAGRASGVTRQWLQNVAYQCGVSISVETESHMLNKVYYVTYTGEYRNSLCFWESIQKASGPRY